MLRRLTRRKLLHTTSGPEQGEQTLARVLTTLDLTALGVGATLGVGIYVLAGEVARDTAGPAVLLSFLIAGFVSLLSAVCYAELGARVPLCGSAYVYSYVAVGEFVGFVIGWNLLLEYVIGTASVARAYSGYLDSILNNAMQDAFRRALPINIPFLSPYPDFFAFGITCALTVILSLGVKESTRFNNIFTCLNVGVVLFVTVFGFVNADVANWHIAPEAAVVNGTHYGDGGFFPYGINGVLAGAATCFYGFVGFDAIATSGEEAKDPQRAIPISLMASLAIIALAYCGVSSTLTLMVPYYLQDPTAPLPAAFAYVGWDAGRWIVTVGALFGLSTSLLGAMFPLPRVMLAMAQDGLIFRWLARVHPGLHTPVLATVIGGLVTALLAMLFDLSSLVDMMSIGTLMAYMMVAASVLVLHYQPGIVGEEGHQEPTGRLSLSQLVNWEGLKEPDSASATASQLWITAYMVVTTGEAFLLAHYLPQLEAGLPLHWSLLQLGAALMFLALAGLWLQPRSRAQLSFRTPLVPALPALAIFFNIFLMMKLSLATWVRFLVWLVLGLAIYGGYGWRHSSEELRSRGVAEPRREGEEENTEDRVLGE